MWGGDDVGDGKLWSEDVEGEEESAAEGGSWWGGGGPSRVFRGKKPGAKDLESGCREVGQPHTYYEVNKHHDHL